MNVLKAIGKKLINNLGLKILSILLAILIWIVVVSIDNPVKTQVFTSIPVEIENADVMEEAGKAFEVADSSKTVSVSVRAERSILSQLSRDNFEASIDLSDYADGRVPIIVKATKYADRITSVVPRTSYASVKVEDLGEKQFSIEAQAIGEVSEGYSVGDVSVANNVVKVSGPDSIVSTIDKAEVAVSVKGITRDIRTDAPIMFYDRNGKMIDQTELTLSRTETSVVISIWKNKEVPVTYAYSGKPADGYAATGAIAGSIANVSVTGPASATAGVKSIDVPSGAVDISGAAENKTVKVDIANYLPSGVSFAQSDFKSESTVTVTIEALTAKNVEVPTTNIRIDDVPEGMTAIIGGVGNTVVVSVKGLSDALTKLDVTKITGTVNMGNVAKVQGITEWTTGVYDADVQFAYPNGIYAGDATVSVKIILKEADSVSSDSAAASGDTENTGNIENAENTENTDSSETQDTVSENKNDKENK